MVIFLPFRNGKKQIKAEKVKFFFSIDCDHFLAFFGFNFVNFRVFWYIFYGKIAGFFVENQISYKHI